MAESKLRIDVETDWTTDVETLDTDDDSVRILIHNDNVTTFEFVIDILQRIFRLSKEIAEHIAWETHTRDVAPVATRPKSEAERLVNQAHAAARANGFPLTFTIEPKE
ncbi:MAG: ATP-dependent Clp protease adaptor ClpS [Caldilineaceae bacterium]|nr:ATP-dependent Clp protease adaptor ClpS [Caldilineaceae bacterium]